MGRFLKSMFNGGPFFEKSEVLSTDGLKEKFKKRALNVLKGAGEIVLAPLKLLRIVKKTAETVMDIIGEPFESGRN